MAAIGAAIAAITEFTKEMLDREVNEALKRQQKEKPEDVAERDHFIAMTEELGLTKPKSKRRLL